MFSFFSLIFDFAQVYWAKHSCKRSTEFLDLFQSTKEIRLTVFFFSGAVEANNNRSVVDFPEKLLKKKIVHGAACVCVCKSP